MTLVTRRAALATLLLVAAALIRFGFAPWLNRLPADYANETQYTAETRFRGALTEAWVESALVARRTDQTLYVTGGVALIQGDVHWTTPEGAPTYETTTLYGVDRDTRQNLSGYGDRERNGQFLFPLHAERATYAFWDPFYLGPRTAEFDHVDSIEGLTVYVYHYTGRGIDDTDGLSFLPNVPERYLVHSDGDGTLWIEPTSGVVVDMEDAGVSYFVEAATGARLADMYIWADRYTPETRAEQLRLARLARARILALEVWLPVGLLGLGFVVLIGGLWRRTPPQPPPPVADESPA